MNSDYREIIISLASAVLGAVVGAAGTFGITVYQNHEARAAAAPDLALSCNDTLSGWQRGSRNTLIVVGIDPSHYLPGRYNEGPGTMTFVGPHYPRNLPEYLKTCTLRNDGDEVARMVTLQLDAIIAMRHGGQVSSFAYVPITVGFDAVAPHTEGTFLVANMNAGEGNLGATNSAQYETLHEKEPERHRITLLTISRYLHPMRGACKAAVNRWPPVICLSP